MNARRILIITNRVPYPLNDGGNLAMHAMIEGYHNAGWAVHVLSMNTSRHHVSDEQLTKLYNHIAGFTALPVYNDIKAVGLLRNLLFSRQPNHAQRFFTKAFKEKIGLLLGSFRPDVVQLESVFTATYIPYIRRELKAAKISIRLHNIEYQIWERMAAETSNKMKRLYLHNLSRRMKRFEAWAWNKADVLVPITNTDAEVLRKAGVMTKVIVAPFCIDINDIKTTSAEEQWVGYHIGAMDWLPNAEAINWFLQDIWPCIKKKTPEFHFCFAGRHMPDKFKHLHIDGVTCVGEVPDANAFIADKKILIVPLRSGGGIRVKILEAMAAGKVIISTRVGMQGIEAIGGIHYRLADTEEEFADAVKWCLNNKDKATEMGRNARSLILSNYNADRIMKNVADSLDSLISSK